jgi:hypothetical protein
MLSWCGEPAVPPGSRGAPTGRWGHPPQRFKVRLAANTGLGGSAQKPPTRIEGRSGHQSPTYHEATSAKHDQASSVAGSYTRAASQQKGLTKAAT